MNKMFTWTDSVVSGEAINGINMQRYDQTLSSGYREGYRLSHVTS